MRPKNIFHISQNYLILSLLPCPDDPLARDHGPLLGRVSRPRGSGVPTSEEQGEGGGGDGGQDRVHHRHARHRLQVNNYFLAGCKYFSAVR